MVMEVARKHTIAINASPSLLAIAFFSLFSLSTLLSIGE